jgi:hypothetical protein
MHDCHTMFETLSLIIARENNKVQIILFFYHYRMTRRMYIFQWIRGIKKLRTKIKWSAMFHSAVLSYQNIHIIQRWKNVCQGNCFNRAFYWSFIHYRGLCGWICHHYFIYLKFLDDKVKPLPLKYYPNNDKSHKILTIYIHV